MLDINRKQTIDVAEGQYIAVPTLIADLGQQFQSDWQTGEIMTWPDGNPKIQDEVFISFSLLTLGEDGADGKIIYPRVGKTFTVSTNEKAAIVGLMRAAGVKTTSLLDLIGKAVMVDVGHTNTGNAKVRAFSRAGTKVLVGDDVITVANLVEQSPECVVYDRDAHDDKVYETLPEFIRTKIENQASRALYTEMKAGGSTNVKTQPAAPKQTEQEVEDILDDIIPY